MPQLCRTGTCDLDGPAGRVSFSEVSAVQAGQARTSTAFDVDYAGWKGLCRGPLDGARPFECTFMERATGASATLSVGAGCTRADLVYASGERLELRTDSVDVLGHRAPAREVALLDARGVVAFTDNPGPRITFHRSASSRAALPTEQALALVAMHSYAAIEGTPPECLVAPAVASR